MRWLLDGMLMGIKLLQADIVCGEWFAMVTHRNLPGGSALNTAPLFGGTFTHTLDTAGRFVLPRPIRTSIGDDFYITKGAGCLLVLSEAFANQLRQELLSLAGDTLSILLNPEIARIQRHFFSEMVRTKADNQNRVQLTPEHRRYAGIQSDGDLVVCGCGSYAEIWAPDKLAIYRAANEDADSLIAAGVALTGGHASQTAGEDDAGVPSHTGSS
jgi:MraZ protein